MNIERRQKNKTLFWALLFKPFREPAWSHRTCLKALCSRDGNPELQFEKWGYGFTWLSKYYQKPFLPSGRKTFKQVTVNQRLKLPSFNGHFKSQDSQAPIYSNYSKQFPSHHSQSLLPDISNPRSESPITLIINHLLKDLSPLGEKGLCIKRWI